MTREMFAMMSLGASGSEQGASAMLAVAAFLPLAFVVTLGGLGLLTLYQRMGVGEFWVLVAAAEGLDLTRRDAYLDVHGVPGQRRPRADA